MIYLDNNATTAIDPRVIEAIVDQFRRGPANASSLHRGGQSAAAAISAAMDTIGTALQIDLGRPGGARLIFTSGGTESNHLAITGIRGTAPLLVSAIEHPSVIADAETMARRGRVVETLPVDDNGVIQLDVAEEKIARLSSRSQPPVVAVMAANNETGVIQPIPAIAEICRRHAAHLHVDATQTVGKLPIDLSQQPVGSITFAAHKFHGPAGVGGLLIAPGVTVEPVFRGGGQQLDSRGGTEPVALIVGMAAALRFASDEMPAATAHSSALRDCLENELTTRFPNIVIQGRRVERLPQTTCLSLVGADRQSMLMALDMAGIAASSGSACSSGSSPPSHVLLAMNRATAEVDSAIRFGVSKWTRSDEINTAIEAIDRIYRRMRRPAG